MLAPNFGSFIAAAVEGFSKSSPSPALSSSSPSIKEDEMVPVLLPLALILATASTTAVFDDLTAAVEFCRRPPPPVTTASVGFGFGGNGGGAIPGCGDENEIGDEEEDLRRRRRRRRRSAFVPYKTGKELSEQVSGTLDKVLLFSGYDKQIRPGVSRS